MGQYNNPPDLSKSLAGMTARLHKLESTGAIGAWITLTLLNSWANVGSDAAAAYATDGQGRVYLRGAITGGTGGTEPFVLPSTLAPPNGVHVPLGGHNGSTAQAAFLQINAGGTTALFVETNSSQIYLTSSWLIV